jgi:hypothetical protein
MACRHRSTKEDEPELGYVCERKGIEEQTR